MKRFTNAMHVRVGVLVLIAWLGLIFLVWSTVATLLYPILPRQSGTRVGQWALSWCFRVYLFSLRLSGFCHFDLKALDVLKEEGGLVIASNHPALIDVLLITSRLPRLSCIMKADLWSNIFLRGGARLARFIGNNAPTDMVKLAVEEINRGSQLLIFPEGTRTVKKPINPFKGGYALIAKQAAVPVQTVFIETNSPYLCKGWPIFQIPELPLYYRVRLGRRFKVTGNVKAFNRELEEYFAQELLTVHSELSTIMKKPLRHTRPGDATSGMGSILTHRKAT